MRYARGVSLALCLAGCGPPEIVAISPTLKCEQVVKCHIFTWQLGPKSVLALSGTHVVCKCEGD